MVDTLQGAKLETYLPYPDFKDCAAVLDRRTLRQQCRDAKRVMLVLEGTVHKFQTHPTVLFWKGYPEALALYGFVMCTEARKRGYRNDDRAFFGARSPKREFNAPPLLGEASFHLAERSKLSKLLPQWYEKLWPKH